MNQFETSETQTLSGSAFIKAAVLLTIGIFLISAPTPDPRVIEEMTSNLIVFTKNPALAP